MSAGIKEDGCLHLNKPIQSFVNKLSKTHALKVNLSWWDCCKEILTMHATHGTRTVHLVQEKRHQINQIANSLWVHHVHSVSSGLHTRVADYITWWLKKTTRCGHADYVQDIKLTRHFCNTIEVSHSFFTGNRARLIIWIHLSETICVCRTGSRSQIINIGPSVPTGELEQDTGQLCCCGWSTENNDMSAAQSDRNQMFHAKVLTRQWHLRSQSDQYPYLP